MILAEKQNMHNEDKIIIGATSGILCRSRNNELNSKLKIKTKHTDPG